MMHRFPATTYNRDTLLPPVGGDGSLTCVSVQDLAAVGQELEHLELAAVGGHHDVAVLLPQELHVQDLVVVAHKLQAGGEKTHLIICSRVCGDVGSWQRCTDPFLTRYN